jgi:hypothetical protein
LAVSCSLVSWSSAGGGVVSMVCIFENFHMLAANVLEAVKFQACLLLCSCRVERINPIRGVGYRFSWLLSFRTEETLYILQKSCIYFQSYI